MAKNKIYDDETLKNSTNEGDKKNYQMIKDYQNAYMEAEKTGDTTAMEKAHKGAEAVRAVYGYSTDNPYKDIQPQSENLAPSQNPQNSYIGEQNPYSNLFGEDAYKTVKTMQNDGFNAYKDMVNQNASAAEQRLNRNRRNIEQNYQLGVEALNQNKQKELDALPEQLAKIGLYGSGSGETAYSNIISKYSTLLKDLLKSKNDAIYDLDGQIEAVKNQGATEIAQYYASLMQSQPDVFLSMLNNQLSEKQYNFGVDNTLYERNENEKRYGEEIEYRNKVYEDNRNDIAYGRMMDNADRSANAGNYNPYVDLGIVSPEQAKFNENVYKDNLLPKVSGGSSGGSSSGTNKQLIMSNIDSDISHWLYSPENIDGDGYFYKGWDENTNPIYAAKDKINDANTVRYIKNALISAGYTAAQANSKISEYKKSIAGQIATIEGNDKTVEDIMKRYGW